MYRNRFCELACRRISPVGAVKIELLPAAA